MSIFATADTHGSINRLLDHSNLICEDDTLFIAGDFGCIWEAEESKYEKSQLDALAAMPFISMVVDGNHENFSRLNSLPTESIYGGKVGVIRDGKVFHCKRGEIFNIDESDIFTMGGALSIDKHNRIDGISWWREEIPSYGEIDNAINNLLAHNNSVDYIITHTAPVSVVKKHLLIDYNSSYNDFNNDSTCSMLQNVVLDEVSFKKWYFGHWHIDCSFEQNKFNCLYYDIVRIV